MKKEKAKRKKQRGESKKESFTNTPKPLTINKNKLLP
jgi:hypothetical protein